MPETLETEQQVLQKIHTSCKNCLFAKYVDEVQVDCKMNRLEPFRAHDNLVEAEDMTDKKFFIVNGRFCNAYQDAAGEFAKKVPPDEWATIMRKMLNLRLTVLVMVQHGTDPQTLEPTIEALKSQTMLPHQVIFINNQKMVKPGDFHARLFKQIGNSMTWRINQIFEDGGRVSRERAIDHSIGSVTGAYYTVFNAGFVPPTDFVTCIDKSLNDAMERFSMLLPLEDGNGLTVQTDMHKHPQINGNTPMVYEVEGDYIFEEPPALDGEPRRSTKPICLDTVVEKLQHYATIQNKTYMVRNVTDICPSMSSSNHQ